MSIFQRIAMFFSRLVGTTTRGTIAATQTRASTAPREAVNDALAYGVAIEGAAPAPGTWYWQAVRVHHLTPEENGGNHHIYIDMLDPELGGGSNSMGERVFGGRARVTWNDGEQLVVVDKPLNEPGTNLPMWKWQVCAAEALGLPGRELPSDRVTGLHTGHPDEAVGNTLFHHSFSVTFVKVQAPAVVYTDSVIYGVIHHAGGRTAVLRQNETAVARQVLGADGAFRFTDLGSGEYIVAVEGTPLCSQPVRADGRNQVQVDLDLVLADSMISGRVRNGTGRALRLIRNDAAAENTVDTAVVSADESYRFAGLAAGEYCVLIVGAGVRSALLTVDGANSVTADLVAPAPAKSLAHIVLFGPAGDQTTLANLLLAQDYLMTFKLSFSFSATEAANAGLVTIIAGEDAVPAGVATQLAADGTPVQRIAGTVDEVADALAARIAQRQAF